MSAREAFDTAGTDKGFYHGYEIVYDRLPVPKRLLELGVYEGHSMRAWRLLWPACQLWGIESTPRPFMDFAGDQNTYVIFADAYAGSRLDPDLMFDLIVDDADHNPDHQLAGIDTYWPHLVPGGWYVIEDVFMDPSKNTAPLRRELAARGWESMVDARGEYEIYWTRKDG